MPADARSSGASRDAVAGVTQLNLGLESYHSIRAHRQGPWRSAEPHRL